MTLHNAWTTKPVPLVKAASFTFLTETEVAGMRTFINPHDSRIVVNEVFFLRLNKAGEIEGDDYADSHAKSAATPSYSGHGRRKYEQLVVGGKSNSVAKQPCVMWNNHTVSPAVLAQVFLSGGVK